MKRLSLILILINCFIVCKSMINDSSKKKIEQEVAIHIYKYTSPCGNNRIIEEPDSEEKSTNEILSPRQEFYR